MTEQIKNEIISLKENENFLLKKLREPHLNLGYYHRLICEETSASLSINQKERIYLLTRMLHIYKNQNNIENQIENVKTRITKIYSLLSEIISSTYNYCISKSEIDMLLVESF